MAVDYARYRCIRATRQGRILVLVLDRPPMNAVDGVLHAELATIFADVGHDRETDVVVLTGTGRAFSAGGDTAWFRHVAGDPRALDLVQREGRLIVHTLLDLEQPVIAAAPRARARQGVPHDGRPAHGHRIRRDGGMMRIAHRLGLVSAVAVLALGALGAGRIATVESWQTHRPGATGVPAGWSELPLLQRALVKLGTLEIVKDDGRPVLRLKTDTDQHTIIRKKVHVDLAATPVLEWQWKVVTFPAGADLRQRSRSDSPAVLALAWASPARIVSYAWDVSAPIDSRFDNPKQSRVHYIVVRSGEAGRGTWQRERRDVAADYRSVFGEAPTAGPEEMELSIDSNDTRSVAETLIGEIRFVARP